MDKHKALAYIIQNDCLLVYNPDYANDPPYVANEKTSIPGGTIESGESPEQGLYREIWEEAGFSDISIIQKLGVFKYYRQSKNRYDIRHMYMVSPNVNLPKKFSYKVNSKGNDNNVVFEYFWLPVQEVKNKLSLDKGLYLCFANY